MLLKSKAKFNKYESIYNLILKRKETGDTHPKQFPAQPEVSLKKCVYHSLKLY